MKTLPPMIALLALLSFSALPVFGQKLVCRCEKKVGRTCATSVSCSDGCTSICGPGKKDCPSVCRKEGTEKQFTLKLENKTGKQIVSELSTESGLKIMFKAHQSYWNQRYDLDLKNDDVFNALNFLSKRGTVTINDIPFADFKWNRAQEQGTKPIRPDFK